MTRRLGALAIGSLLLAACTSSPTPTVAPAASPSSAPTPTAIPTAPEPTFPFAVACAPLDPGPCQSAVAFVRGHWPPEMDPITGLSFQPLSAHLSCSPSAWPSPAEVVCGVVAMATTAGGPVDSGIVLVGSGWSKSRGTDGWWGADDSTYCFLPAAVRLAGRIAPGIGNCAGSLGDPRAPNTIKMVVGQALDLHVRSYSLPWSTAPTVIDQESIQDAATATYVALGPGTAVLMTTGPWCWVPTPTGLQEGMAVCPLAKITVVPSM